MKHASTLFFTLVVLLIGASGCVHRHGDFTAISNKNVNLSDFNLDQPDRKRSVEGKDVQHIVIFFPTSGPPTLEGALDHAFETHDGDVMTDAVVTTWYYYIPYLYGQSGWKVKGDMVKTRQ